MGVSTKNVATRHGMKYYLQGRRAFCNHISSLPQRPGSFLFTLSSDNLKIWGRYDFSDLCTQRLKLFLSVKYTDNGQQWRGAEAKADVCNLNATLKLPFLKSCASFLIFAIQKTTYWGRMSLWVTVTRSFQTTPITLVMCTDTFVPQGS